MNEMNVVEMVEETTDVLVDSALDEAVAKSGMSFGAKFGIAGGITALMIAGYFGIKYLKNRKTYAKPEMRTDDQMVEEDIYEDEN